MKRFLVMGTFANGQQVRLSPEETKHALRVMRLSAGATILIANGQGEEAEAVLLDEDRAGALVEVRNLRESKMTTRLPLTLVQATLKGSRMDWLIEKATELGVDRLQVVQSEHSVGQMEKIERWERLARAAVKQSGNLRIPELCPPKSLNEWLAHCSTPAIPSGRFLLSPDAPLGLAPALHHAKAAGAKEIFLAIGPEGGFSQAEEEAFQVKGFQPCLLSPQILRGETAGLAALAIALHALDFPQ